MVIFGQDDAVARSERDKASASGTREGEKPIGSFCFQDPRAWVKRKFVGSLRRLWALS